MTMIFSRCGRASTRRELAQVSVMLTRPHPPRSLSCAETRCWGPLGGGEEVRPASTAVLSKIPHCDSSKSAPNRPLWGRRGRFGTLLQQLECGIFGRTAVHQALHHCHRVGERARHGTVDEPRPQLRCSYALEPCTGPVEGGSRLRRLSTALARSPAR